jgi:hypothetical protein
MLFVNFLHDYYQKMPATAIRYFADETVPAAAHPLFPQAPESTVKSIIAFLQFRVTFWWRIVC